MVSDRESLPSAPCADCGVECWPWEIYSVTDEVWAEADDPKGCLCIECLEEKLDRYLVSGDFPSLPINDNEGCDSVRLRTPKGSGRRTDRLHGIAVAAAVDLGVDPGAGGGEA